MKQEEKDLMAQGANRFMFWAWNYICVKSPIDGEYYPDAIVKTKWGCSLAHIQEKWDLCCRRTNHKTDWAVVEFYGELDAANRRRFLEYIMGNYNDEQKI